MNIVFIQADDNPSTKIRKELYSLQKKGYRISFLGWDRTGKSLKEEFLGGIKYKRILLPSGYANWKVAVCLPFWLVLGFANLLKINADVVHAADFEAALPAAFWSLIKRKPFVYDILDTFYMRGNRPKWICYILMVIDKWIMSRAKHIIVVDENRIAGVESCYTEKITVIYNSPPDQMRLHGHEVNKPFTIYINGLLMKKRGVEMILQAIKSVEGSRVLMAGRVIEKELEIEIKNHPQVEFRGFVSYDEALKIYNESDAVCSFYDPASPIHVNASSNKLFDAMMSARPVIINNEIKMAKLVDDLNCGYTCPYNDVDKLIEILRRIRNNPNEAREKGINGRKAYERFYKWETMEKKLYDVYALVSGSP